MVRGRVAAPGAVATTAVTSTIPSPGNSAFVDGGTVDAGGDLIVAAEETIDVALDTSFTFALDLDDAGFTTKQDRAVLTTRADSEAYIQGEATIDARDVVFFISLIAFWLYANAVLIEMKKAS